MNTQNIIWKDKRKRTNKLRLLPVVFYFVLVYLLITYYREYPYYLVGIIIVIYLFAIISVHSVFNIFWLYPLKVTKDGLLLDPYTRRSKMTINFLTLYKGGYNLLIHKRKKQILIPWSEIRCINIFLISGVAAGSPAGLVHTLIFFIFTVNISKLPHKRIVDFSSPVFDKKGLLLTLDKLLAKDFSKEEIITGFKYARR